jgi:sugar phosphate isomerase/epimerase
MNVSVRDAMVPVNEGDSFFTALRDLGLNAVELEVRPDGSLPNLVENGASAFSIADAAGLERLKERLAAENVSLSALLMGTDFSGDEADRHVEWAIHTTRAAHQLGAPAVRIDTATRNSELSVAQIRDNFVRRIRRVLDATQETGVGLGIENHGRISNDPQFLEEVFAAVPDARLGMTLDTGNFYWYGWPLEELYGILEHFAPRARHTHVKNINYPPELANRQREIGYEYGQYCSPLDEGNIDIRRVVHIRRDAGYQDDLCIENEALGKYPAEERPNIIRRDAQTLRAALEG